MQLKNIIKAIVWDLDGTIIHFKIDSMGARRIAIDILKLHGISKKDLSVKKGIMDNIETAQELFKKKGFKPDQIDEIFKEIDNEISKIEYKAALNASAIGGIEDVLKFLKERNLKQAIYTLNKNKHAKISLEKVDLLNYFDVIIGRDNVKNAKPHPEHLLEICERLQVKPNEIIVIGDTSRDIEGAINVGAYSIALLTKLAKAGTLQKANIIVEEKEIPTKLIEEFEKLL